MQFSFIPIFWIIFPISDYYWAYLELINFMNMFIRKAEVNQFPIFTRQNYPRIALTFRMEQYLISALLTWENIREGKCTLRKLNQCIVGYTPSVPSPGLGRESYENSETVIL